jgi:hypothetical protein
MICCYNRSSNLHDEMNDEVLESLILNRVLMDMKVQQIHKNLNYIQQNSALNIVHVIVD